MLSKIISHVGSGLSILYVSIQAKYNYLFVFFPEGSHGEPEKLQAFQKGVGAILKRRPNIPYIPIFMKEMGRVLPKGEKLLVPFDSFVSIGPKSCTNQSEVTLIVKEVEGAVRKQSDVLLHLFKH